MLTLRTTRWALLLTGLVFALTHAGVPGQGAKKSDSVVKASATAEKPDGEGKQVVTVTLMIDTGWHTYANSVPADFPGLPTTVSVDQVKKESVKVDYPTGKAMKDPTVGDYSVYEGKVDIKVVVQRDKGDTAPLAVNVKVQACSDKQCLLPSTIKVMVP